MHDVQIALEIGKGLVPVSVACISGTAEGGAQGDGGHAERTALHGGVALIHILYALVAAVGVAHAEVYLEVGERFHGGLDLHVFCAGCGGGGAHAVRAEQPAAFLGAFDIGVAHKTEAEVDAGAEGTIAAAAGLSQHVAHLWQETGQGQVVGVAVAQAHVAQ